ncbi:MAG TPA: S9 family peptidase, partial [Pyrinomonadaceae bacterium]|nr:S9 family peptidase [Pyrinomonadaceae bacterium]
WLIDVETRKASELVKSDYVVSDLQWSPDGRSIAYVTVPTPRADDGSLSDIWVAEAATGRTRKLVENEGPDTSPRWSADGQWLAYLSRDAKGGLLGQTQLTVVAASGGASRGVASAYEYQPGQPVWSADGRTLYFVSSVRTGSQLFEVDAAGGSPRQLTRGRGVMSGASFSRDRSVVAFTRSDTENPSDVYVARLSSIGEPTKMTNHNPQAREFALGRGEVVRWKSKDGTEIEGILLYPVGYEAGKRYPLVTLVHGGPAGAWTEGFPASWGNYGHVWAGKGWAVFYPNVRGSSNYGERFQLSNVRDWGGGDFQDIQTGIDFLVAKGVADPEKLAQSGWSYGGYMTAWTITQTNRFKAAMVGAGITNLFSMYSTNDLPRYLGGYFGGEPWNDTEAYGRASAMTFVKRAKTPTLILHGAEDKRVPVSQAQELYMGLRQNGVPVEMVLYPRQAHSLQEPRHQLDKMRREYAWFSKYVLGVEVPEPAKKEDDKKPDDKSTGN